METRKLGRASLELAPLILGGNVFGWTVDEPTAFALLDAFVDAGFNCIDTSNGYSRWVSGNKGGESEAIIGNWLHRRPGMRARVLIATKVGSQLGPGRGGLSRKHILEEADLSLQRLRTDYLDLYQSHLDDISIPLDETLEAHAKLFREGKIRAIGASNHTAPRLAAALEISAVRGYPRYECLQPRYNLYDRCEFEADLADLCHRQQLGVIPYFSLASGFLTGKYRSGSEFGGSARGEFMTRFKLANVGEMFDERGRRILAALDKVSNDLGATPAQVSLAWLLARGVTAPIASATSLRQLSELVKGVMLELPAGIVALLDEASNPVG